MDDQQLKTRLREELARLTDIDGVSGHEQNVVLRLRELMKPLADRVEIDVMGNLYARRDGGNGAKHLMVCAHSDEIGGLVSAIEPGGWLRFQTVGGIAEALLIGRKVRIRGLLGVVGVRPGHMQSESERRTAPELEQLYIDLGLNSAAEVHALGIRPGDGITWQSELESVANPDRVVGKAVDNRIGCVVVLELLRVLQVKELSGPLTIAVAVQEEVGLKGAGIAAERVKPDCALVVDTTPCTDTPDSAHVHTFPVRLGGGPVLQVSSGRNAGGFILPESVRDYLIRIAEAEDIPYQLATFAYGNTDATAIHVTAGGIPTAVATMPRRYSHSPVEMLDLNDAVSTLRLCRAVVEQVDGFPSGMIGQ
jgi:putative aminopeptidase